MTDIWLDKDNGGRWILTCPVDCDGRALRLTVEASGTPHDWHAFTAVVVHPEGCQVLGTFDVAPAELYSERSPWFHPAVPRWNPNDEEDFQRVATIAISSRKWSTRGGW